MTDAFIKELEAIELKLQRSKKDVLVVGANEILSRLKFRIFTDGLDSSGNGIGTYSTKRLYINPKTFDKKHPLLKGRLGSPKKGRKTVRFDNGWLGVRKQANGLNGTNVTTRFSGDLRDSIVNAVEGDKVVVGILNKRNVLKAEWMEERYGKNIYSPSDEEINAGINVILSTLGL